MDEWDNPSLSMPSFTCRPHFPTTLLALLMVAGGAVSQEVARTAPVGKVEVSDLPETGPTPPNSYPDPRSNPLSGANMPAPYSPPPPVVVEESEGSYQEVPKQGIANQERPARLKAAYWNNTAHNVGAVMLPIIAGLATFVVYAIALAFAQGLVLGGGRLGDLLRLNPYRTIASTVRIAVSLYLTYWVWVEWGSY